MTELKLALLGKLDIRLDGEPVTGLTSAKAQALLCYLAVTGRSNFRTSLAGLLWGDMPEANARTNLRRELSALRRTVRAHLIITRQEVAFNRDAPYWLDVEVFESGAGHAPQSARHLEGIERLREAVELYRGDFLEGFYVRDAPAFEEWVLVQGTRLRELALQALHKLSVHFAEQGKAGLEEGITYTSRLLALEPSREEAHQQLMLLLAQSGQRGAALAQYEVCRQALAEDLGVEPGPETRELYERIRDGEVHGELLIVREPKPRRESAVLVPGFLADEERPEPERLVFVARERELARLDGYLDQALAGKGQVVFTTGGPGRGKTALMTEFARRAMDRHPELLLGMGNCNAYSGVGDPYLPFREVLGMLTGDVEARWAAGTISREHARRLWQAVPLASRALLDHGPYLIGTLVTSPALLSRAAATVDDNAGRKQLWGWAARELGAQGELQQSAIFEQYTNVLCALAEQRPLLLLLDDLQWTDTASAGLLFHLGRRLAGARILIVGAYRVEEVALSLPWTGSGERGRHPLEKALGEFKRQYGDVWLDLSHTEETEGRRFVDALLATEPSRLDKDFRNALVKRTGGHALFTVELLRAMQERGDLVKDADGAWTEGRAVDWETLPARVEAVIEERIGRLSPELRDILAVASVEGEEFTAQAIARVQGKGERELFRLLSHELGQRHRLVREQGSLTVDGRRLWRYRFAHALHQQYLYLDLSEGERALLHGEVAAALEELYEGHTDEIAVQLVRHYAGAGDPERERHQAKVAGERAYVQFAFTEAVHFWSRALELTPQTDATRAERYDLLMTSFYVHFDWGALGARAEVLAKLEQLAEQFHEEPEVAATRAGVALAQARFGEARGDYASAINASQAAVRLAWTAQNVEIEARGYWLWGLMLAKQGDATGARSKYELALALAQAAGDDAFVASCLRGLGLVYLDLGDFADAEAYLQQSLSFWREMGRRPAEAWVLQHLSELSVTRCDFVMAEAYLEQAMGINRQFGWPMGKARAPLLRGRIMRRQGRYCQARICFEQAVRGMRELGEWGYYNTAIIGLGCVLQDLGDYASARVEFERALSNLRELGARHLEGRVASHLALLAHQRGDDEVALEQSQRALGIAQDTGHRDDEAYALTHLGHALAGLGQLDEAADAYQRALEMRIEMGQPPLVSEVQAGLSRVALAQGDAVQALVHVEEILTHLETGSLDGTDEAFRIYLTCYRVLRANEDPRADEVLTTAHDLLQERAAKIDDEELHRSFLENVAANKEIVSEFNALLTDRA